jgi:serine/threonine-protein kinase
LKVNPKTYAPVTIPDIIDGYKGLAFRKLERLELKVGDTIYEPNIQKDAVIRMMYNGAVIKPGAKVPMFSTIDLVIGTGPKRNVTIPNLVGMTVAQAKVVIAQNLFEVGLVDHQDGGKDNNDIVYYQDPAMGSVRDQGMQIDLWASKKTPAEMQSKIRELDEMYRPKIEISSPPVEDFSEPTEEPATPAPAPQKQPTVKVEEKTVAKKTTETKPTEVKPVEKKPAKKVIVE